MTTPTIDKELVKKLMDGLSAEVSELRALFEIAVPLIADGYQGTKSTEASKNFIEGALKFILADMDRKAEFRTLTKGLIPEPTVPDLSGTA